MKKLVPLGLLLALSGCQSIPKAPPAPETIRYETGPCFGVCPVYTVTVSSDGIASFEGKQNTQIIGRRSFVIRADEYEAFKAALAPWRPNGEAMLVPGKPECMPEATDMPSVDVRWSKEEGSDHLFVYFGCNMDANQVMFDALADAPMALPLNAFVGQR